MWNIPLYRPGRYYIFSCLQTFSGYIICSRPACIKRVCNWTDWYNDENGGKLNPFDPYEREEIDDVLESNPDMCGRPVDVECRIAAQPGLPFEDITGQLVTCDIENGLECQSDLSSGMFCYDYEMRIRCCHYEPCGITTPEVTTQAPTTSE